jgi:hypothetical protein
MRCCNLIEVRVLNIHFQDLSKDSFGVCRASVLCWYSNADMIPLRKYSDTMLLAVLLSCSLVGMKLGLGRRDVLAHFPYAARESVLDSIAWSI